MIGGNAHPFGYTAAVFAHQRLVVGRAGADVQPAIDAFRYAADAGEIAVPDAGERGRVEQRGTERIRSCSRQHCRLVVFGDGFVKAKFALTSASSGGRVGQDCRQLGRGRHGIPAGRIASTLNSFPIWSRSGKAFDFGGDSFARCLVAGRSSRPARSSRPMPSRNSPCVARSASRPFERSDGGERRRSRHARSGRPRRDCRARLRRDACGPPGMCRRGPARGGRSRRTGRRRHAWRCVRQSPTSVPRAPARPRQCFRPAHSSLLREATLARAKPCRCRSARAPVSVEADRALQPFAAMLGRTGETAGRRTARCRR